MLSFSKLSIILAAATVVCADLTINNWCEETLYAYQTNSQPDGKLACNQGVSGKCETKPMTDPYTLKSLKHGGKAEVLHWIENGQGTSIKIARDDKFTKILQFEYTMPKEEGGKPQILFWDLSNIDGESPSVAGSPFFKDNIKVSPSGPGLGEGTCHVIKCKANEICKDAYQRPNDEATLACPATTDDITLDLCLPDDKFNARAVPFTA